MSEIYRTDGWGCEHFRFKKVNTPYSHHRGMCLWIKVKRRRFLFWYYWSKYGKKFYDYGVISPDFRGRFTNHYVVPEKDYKAKKKEASDKAINTSAFTESELDDALFQKVMGNDKLTHNDRMKALGIPEATYFRKLRVWKSENY